MEIKSLLKSLLVIALLAAVFTGCTAGSDTTQDSQITIESDNADVQSDNVEVVIDTIDDEFIQDDIELGELI